MIHTFDPQIGRQVDSRFSDRIGGNVGFDTTRNSERRVERETAFELASTAAPALGFKRQTFVRVYQHFMCSRNPALHGKEVS
jgi:hypothetical protein